MYSKILRLNFPKSEVKKPIVCYLVKDYNLIFNILNASVYPREEGVMVLELTGSKEDFKQGVRYLKTQGVMVKSADQEIKRTDKKCVHCGACTAICPTGALAVERPEMNVNFDHKKCSVCELCIPACPTRAMKPMPSGTAFFK
jgi:L-aspartate semialdehyde sulfurtransferase ferredoxin